jgi:hypothetical protein
MVMRIDMCHQRRLPDGNTSSITHASKLSTWSRNEEGTFTRIRVSDEYWESSSPMWKLKATTVKHTNIPSRLGGIKSLHFSFKEKVVKPSPMLTCATYIFKLEGPLDTLRNVQEAAELSEPPVAIQGIGRVKMPASVV